MTDVVSCRGLELRRDAVKVLEVPDWRIGEGERWVVLGPNGCGKSSLALALLGRLHPWEGELAVLGLAAGKDDIHPLRTRVAFSGDALDPLIDPSVTCLDLVSTGFVGTLGLRFDRPTRRHLQIARSEIRAWGLEGFESRPLSKLSLGQRRRAWLARALAPTPLLLVLDEPCAGLDPAAREDVMLHLERVSRLRPDLPMVLVTHHVEEIPPSFRHALLLGRGTVLAQGDIARTLNSRSLSTLFDRRFRLSRRNGRLAAIPMK